MGVVADIAQRVIVMRQGKIVEQSPAQTLFSAPRNSYTRHLLAAIPAPVDHEVIATRFNENTFAQGLQVEDLSISYAAGFGKKNRVVEGVSFEIAKGEFLGLLGESGCGKTTLGKALLGIVPADAGRITLAGKPIDGKGRTERQRIKAKIGAIFQNPFSSLNPRMTLGQSIAEPLLTHSALTRRDIDARVNSLIDQVGLPATWSARYPYELSGGQCQRIAIARAIALNPELLIADEPTSALDVSIQKSILNLLRDLQQEYQFACLFISHDLAVVRSLCHSAVVLKKGRIVEQGRVGDLFLRPQSEYTQALVDSVPLANPQHQENKRRARAPWLFPTPEAAANGA